MIWLRYSGSKKCVFVCLFVCLLVCVFFCSNNLGIHTERFRGSFVNIRHDLAEIFKILKNRKLDWCDGEKGREGKGRGGEESYFVIV